ncbi:amino acid/polyamine/organocation transporter, APC superfamily [Mucilaginibacter lappiensis]|uniref:Amino acid transporter n=1 Tax=Mucilaginibacter lappiensis TaxID=354630 RepID=A0ABR6PQ33_9SPHI|nr:APC family permease [Mucilaginibacter lappiensis]MBB6111887.1 amino acid transporter [Mucilaginibacter lappiensis]SIR89140.1 amino acid/polyamine/organocation transporter, APC superfamily [Mucilaginibacter lappiensis]
MPSAAALKKIRPIQLIAVIFFTVSGGPYGLEPLLSYAGDHGAILILLITPLLWDVPAIFTVLELNSMMPITGGYYKWVKYALGTRWGFYEGWWTWLYTFVDLAIYPVLFVQYAAFFFPVLQHYQVPVCLLIIWASAGLNILGIVPVGKVSLFLSGAVLAPVIVLIVLAIHRHTGSLGMPSPSLKGITFPSFGMALYTVMWNCLGWDNITTYAEEVEKPVKSYLVSMIIAFLLVMVVYFFITWVAQQSGINHDTLTNDGFPALGVLIAGRWLGIAIAAGGMASTLGIYAAVLLSVSRVPQVMSEDNLLPAGLNKLHSRFKTPYISIIICSLVVSFMVLWTFADLLIIDVTVYGAGLSLEYIALVKLRLKEPLKTRPFRIPLNITGLCLILIFPFLVYAVALGGALSSTPEALKAAVFAVAALLSAEVVWRIILLSKPHLKTS